MQLTVENQVFCRNRSQKAVGALNGDPQVGSLVELDCGIYIINEFRQRCISSVRFAALNVRGRPESMCGTTIRFPVCGLLNAFAGNNRSDARRAELIAGARGSC